MSAGAKLAMRYEFVSKTPLERLFRLDATTGLAHERGPLRPDQTRQSMRDAETGMKTEFDKICRKARFRRDNAKIGDEREAKSGTDGRALYSSNNRRCGRKQTHGFDIERINVRRLAGEEPVACDEISAAAKDFAF